MRWRERCAHCQRDPREVAPVSIQRRQVVELPRRTSSYENIRPSASAVRPVSSRRPPPFQQRCAPRCNMGPASPPERSTSPNSNCCLWPAQLRSLKTSWGSGSARGPWARCSRGVPDSICYLVVDGGMYHAHVEKDNALASYRFLFTHAGF